MSMKKSAPVIALLVFAMGGAAFAEQPEIAYRILSGYVTKKESDDSKGQKAGGIILSSIGGLAIAGAAATWFAGDAISQSTIGAPMDSDVKFGVSLGLGIGGLGMALGGAAIIASKPTDYRALYAEVFAEDDTEVREALSVAVLRDISIKAKQERISESVFNLLVPVVSMAIKAGANLAADREWSDNILSGVYWSAWNIASGVAGLFETTPEERLYEKYLASRDALYGESGR